MYENHLPLCLRLIFKTLYGWKDKLIFINEREKGDGLLASTILFVRSIKNNSV